MTKPLKRKLVNSLYTATDLHLILLEVLSGKNIGVGYMFSYKQNHQKILGMLMQEYLDGLTGQDACEVTRHWESVLNSLANIGASGLAVRALCAVDTALWDLKAQSENLPLFRLLGGTNSSIPVYVGGGWLDQDDDTLVREAFDCVERGYKAYKFKVTKGDCARHVQRVANVRAAVGDDIALMVDANQSLSPLEAQDMAERLSRYNLSWLEEPFLCWELGDYKALREKSPVPIAAGESLYLLREQAPFIRERGYDVVMPDLARCGGPTEFMRVAALAREYGLPVSSHFFTEVSCHLTSACGGTLPIEYVEDWWDELFAKAPRVRDGNMIMDEVPGLGIELDREALAFYRTK